MSPYFFHILAVLLTKHPAIDTTWKIREDGANHQDPTSGLSDVSG